jgi:hypothetical protein
MFFAAFFRERTAAWCLLQSQFAGLSINNMKIHPFKKFLIMWVFSFEEKLNNSLFLL